MPNKKTKIKSYKWGVWAEFIAIIFLTFKGYKILKRRYKTFVGEIDIIGKKGNLLIAIEVKARKNTSSQEALGINQQKRIKRAMMMFMSGNFKKHSNCSARFDLIIISPGKFPKHYLGFWE
jgi:putative endonuclease